MKRFALPLLVAILAIAGCSVKVTTQGQAFVKDHSLSDVFDKALDSVIASDMNPTVTDRDAGLITATREGGLLTGADREKKLEIFVHVKEQEDGFVMATLSATLGGQIVAYGATKKLVENLCTQMSTRLPGATFTIDGKPYVP